MRVDPEDLVRAFQGNGDAFEAFVHDLVRAVARSCGIDPINVHWDYRTNVKDGGRDLVVKVANPQADKAFLPAPPSVWSIKSGDEGVSPASLRNEIVVEHHPKVRKALVDGWVYVWCTVRPANQDQRDAMREAADKVADELHVDRRLIEFRWPEQIQGEVNLYPNVIPIHLSQVAAVLTNVLSLQEWSREVGMGDEWVDFGGRDDVVRRVTEHLLGRGRPNILHIAGLSGIGKTRTVFEACRRTPELNGVFYVEQYEHVGRELHRYLEEDGRYVYLVVDETRLEQRDAIVGRLGEFASRVRVVTIGPAVRQAAITSDDILVLPEPDTDAGVLEVTRAAGAGLPDEILRSIADQSGHDLRLALLLVRASQRTTEFRGVPVVDIEGVWQRLMSLFAQQIGNANDFRKFYEVLTASIDVGMTDDVSGEIVAIAQHFQHSVAHVEDAAATAVRCGLGSRTRRFFEAAPRALAARLFAERVWPRILDHLEDFFLSLPERLGRRFLERCHDCTGPVREEVIARFGDFFLTALSGENATVLASRPASRLFQTWAEFDPNRGLGWLRNAIERATPQQLRSLDGEQDMSGGWRGRRQLVWLCQNLASFAEHFEACEAILFRLALHETETSIGNNSTAIWESLFWPALASTEVPFDRRLPILLRRLRGATSEELPLILGAAVGAIEHRPMGLPAPPRVVGGRVVPLPWRPATWGELGTLRQEAAWQILDIIAGLPDDRSAKALIALVENLQVFRGLGQLDHLRTLFRPDRLNDSLRRQLVAQLEKQIAFLHERSREDRTDASLRPLEDWLAELSPADLATRVRDLTAQRYWSPGSREDRDTRYAGLADELIAAPETFRELADWFAASEAQSADSLGIWIGRRDKDSRLANPVQEWLRMDRCNSVAVGYLSGTAAREGVLPGEWAPFLDALAADRPETAALATVSADVSERGLERLLSVLNRLSAPASRFLRPLAFGGWLQVTGPAQRLRVAEALVRLADAGDLEAVHTGLDIIRMWAHVDPKAIDQALAALALNLLGRPIPGGARREVYLWQQVLQLLCPFYARQVAELVLARITDPASSASWRDEESVEVLIRAAASDPAAVMGEIGSVLLNRDRRAIFGVSNFHGLFEAIGLQHVQAWLEQHGTKYLRWLARHFPRPYLDAAGEPVLPTLTEWLLREHEDDDEAFKWFLMGSHSGKVRSESEVNPERKKLEMQPFLGHELRRAREWAQSEIREEERFDEWFQELDEEQDRR